MPTFPAVHPAAGPAGAASLPHVVNGRRFPRAPRPLAALAATVLALPVGALTPEQAVERALSRPDMQLALQSGIDLARAELVQARTWANPVLRVSHEDPRSPTDGPGETSVMLSQEFQVGGRRRLERVAAELGIGSAQANADALRAALRADVLEHYYTALAGQRRVAGIGAHIQRLGRLAEAADRRRDAGDLSGYESRRIGQLVQAAMARLAIAEAEAGDARAGLSGLIGGPVPVLDPSVPLAPATPPPLGTLAARLDDAAELRALDRRREAAAAALRAAARPASPVTVAMGHKRIGSGGAAGNDALMLEVSVPLPFWDRNQAGVARAAAQAADADARHALRRASAEARLQSLWQQADSLTELAGRLRRDEIPLASELTRIALLSFEAGELELVGLIDALEADLAARERVLDLELRARRATIELEHLSQGDTP